MTKGEGILIVKERPLLWDGWSLREVRSDSSFPPPEIGRAVVIEDGRIKQTKRKVFDVTKVREARSLKLEDFLHELNAYLFKGEDGSLYLYFGDLERAEISGRYDVISGTPILQGDREWALKVMEKEGIEFVRYTVREFRDEEVLKAAIGIAFKLGSCDDVLSYYSLLREPRPEQSLLAGQCMERKGDLLGALRAYRGISEEDYWRVEEKLRAKADELVRVSDLNGDLKALMEATSTHPEYHVPLFKLAIHYYFKRKFSESKRYLEESISRYKSFPSLIMKAKLLIEEGDFKGAFEAVSEAEKFHRNGISAHLKGICLQGLNASSMAEREFALACSEGVFEACAKVDPRRLNQERYLDPNLWVGMRIYGYDVQQVIGTGGTGFVLKVSKEGKDFAMKVFRSDVRLGEMLREASKMQELSDNDYVVRTYGTYLDVNYRDPLRNPQALVMDFMAGGDLKAILTSEDYSSLRHSSRWPDVVALIFSRIAKALAYIHRQGYVHCDVKPSNVLFTSPLPRYGDQAFNSLRRSSSIPKLSDLGSAVKVGDFPTQYTPYYAHPLHRFGSKAEPMMDVYSLGVSVYVALTGTYPLPQWLEDEIESAVVDPRKREQVMRAFHRTQVRMDQVHHNFRELIEQSLSGELTAEEVSKEMERVAERGELFYDTGRGTTVESWS